MSTVCFPYGNFRHTCAPYGLTGTAMAYETVNPCIISKPLTTFETCNF